MIIQQYLLLRHLLKQSKNTLFNDFFITNFLKNSTIAGVFGSNKNTFSTFLNKSNFNLWEKYKIFQQYNDDQLFLDLLFKKSKYFLFYNQHNKNKVDENLIISNFTKKILSNAFDLSTHFKNTKILEDSLIYQNRLNEQLINLLDNQINNFSRSQYKQQKTFRGIFKRFYFEFIYLSGVSLLFNLNNFFFFFFVIFTTFLFYFCYTYFLYFF